MDPGHAPIPPFFPPPHANPYGSLFKKFKRTKKFLSILSEMGSYPCKDRHYQKGSFSLVGACSEAIEKTKNHPRRNKATKKEL